MSKKTEEKTEEKAEALARLREWLKPGDTVYTVLRRVSRSGMSRQIGLVLFEDGRDTHPNHAASVAIGARLNKAGNGLVIGGCGMDMGYHVVHELSARLFPDGFGCIGGGCPSNDHSNWDRDYTPHTCTAAPTETVGFTHKHGGGVRIGKDGVCHWHRSGGYALRHRWL